jgi:hypothetical protein
MHDADDDARIPEVPAEWHDFVDRLGGATPPLTAGQRSRLAALIAGTSFEPPNDETGDQPGTCGWCGRPGRVRDYREEAFGRVTVKDPTLCDVCAALLDLEPGRDGAQLHDSARELALDAVGRADPVARPEPVPVSDAQLRMDRDEARAVARLLAAELISSPALSGEAAPMLTSLPAWVTESDEGK